MRARTLSSNPRRFRSIHKRKSLNRDLRAFLIAVNILNVWQFCDAEKTCVLGDIDKEAFRQMTSGIESNQINTDRRTRISLIIGIYKALRILFIQESHRLEWINSPNKAFGESSPKNVMLSGALTGLYDIRQYLDAALG